MVGTDPCKARMLQKTLVPDVLVTLTLPLSISRWQFLGPWTLEVTDRRTFPLVPLATIPGLHFAVLPIQEVRKWVARLTLVLFLRQETGADGPNRNGVSFRAIILRGSGTTVQLFRVPPFFE